jgi:hypothetical protein
MGGCCRSDGDGDLRINGHTRADPLKSVDDDALARV